MTKDASFGSIFRKISFILPGVNGFDTPRRRTGCYDINIEPVLISYSLTQTFPFSAD